MKWRRDGTVCIQWAFVCTPCCANNSSLPSKQNKRDRPTIKQTCCLFCCFAVDEQGQRVAPTRSCSPPSYKQQRASGIHWRDRDGRERKRERSARQTCPWEHGFEGNLLLYQHAWFLFLILNTSIHILNLVPPSRQSLIIGSRPHLYSHYYTSIHQHPSPSLKPTLSNSLKERVISLLSTIQSSSFLTSPLDVGPSNCIPATLSNLPRVLIVGAGIGGLTLAILLELAGIPYELFERYYENKAYGILNHPSFFGIARLISNIFLISPHSLCQTRCYS